MHFAERHTQVLPGPHNELATKLFDVPSLLHKDVRRVIGECASYDVECADEGAVLDVIPLLLFRPRFERLERHA